MSIIWLYLALVMVLIGVNAFLAGTEMAFVSLREGQIRALASSGQRGRRVAELASEPNRYLGTIQLGITVAGFLSAASAAVSISQPLADLLPLGRYATIVSLTAVTLAIALLTLILGEMVPKRLAMQRAERWALAVSTPLSAFIAVSRPIIAAVSYVTNLVVAAVGGDPNRQRDQISDDEILELVEAQPTLSGAQRQMMAGAVEIADRRLSQILIPRGRVTTIDAETPVELAVQELLESGHSRAPVIDRKGLDSFVGVVHLRQLLISTGVVGDVTIPVLALPESLTVLDALRQLQTARSALAVVVDEHGGAEGIVTVEDIIEELVGEIYDESDRVLLGVEQDHNGSLTVPGSFPIHDLHDLGVDLPVGGYSTIAGLVVDRLGRIAEPGDSVDVGRYTIEVVATERRAIRTVRIDPRPETSDAAAPDPA